MAGSGVLEHVTIRIRFHDGLDYFLKSNRFDQPVTRIVPSRSSVKDIIESCGIPHPEVDLILVNQQPVEFRFRIELDCAIDVYPFSSRHIASSRLQNRGIRIFVADGHLGKLVRDLRLLGIDVAYENNVDDRDLLRVMHREKRALLTRDRPLLMHRIVEDGFFPRSPQPFEQTIETIRRFELGPAIKPFSRCLRCNGVLNDTAKETVINKLEPLTRLYYDDFKQCPTCGQTYWRGSHVAKLERRVAAILAKVETQEP
jgi:uncharacterized protein